MYITDSSMSVREIFLQLENMERISKLKFILYAFDLLNKNQINNHNELNLELIENEDLVVFNMETIGLSNDCCIDFLQYNMMSYNNLVEENKLYQLEGDIIGLTFNSMEKNIISKFWKLNFNDKIDVFSELFIRYDNDTYFYEESAITTFDFGISGFDIANIIRKVKPKMI